MILHVDIDAFFASVEELDQPQLKGHPLAVGGKSESAIVTTANYEARKYGIHSAMPVYIAKRLCPHLILVPTRKNRYSEMSKKVFAILNNYSSKVEKVSIDEAYLDFTHVEDPIGTAKKLQQEVFERTGLTISCGLSYNKFLAKLASDWEKPRGFTEIREEQIPELLKPLPIRKVHGIGRQSEKKLHAIGVETVGDLLSLERSFLSHILGKGGDEIYERIRGIDHRKVEPNRIRKSIGTEETFDEHTRDKQELYKKLYRYSEELEMLMLKKGFYGYTLTVKIKTVDFVTHTRSRTYDYMIKDKNEIYTYAKTLYDELENEEKLRLMGITLSNLVPEEAVQLNFL